MTTFTMHNHPPPNSNLASHTTHDVLHCILTLVHSREEYEQDILTFQSKLFHLVLTSLLDASYPILGIE